MWLIRFMHGATELFLAEAQEDDQLADELIDLQANSGAKVIFDANELTDFWLRPIIAYPGLSRAVLQEMLPFPTIYLREQGFPVLLTMKRKQRNKLEAGSQMRPALSKLEPRTEDLLQKKQEQRSY